MGDKLNTAEYDSKGRCVRHPAIRLRKKKMFGGWKIIIGHCPECCLDEMRRVRDEIGAEQDHDDDGGGVGVGVGGSGENSRRHHRKDKKKSKRERHRDRDGRKGGRKDRESNNNSAQRLDEISEVGSETHMRPSSDGHHHRGGNGNRPHHHNNNRDEGNMSEATGSTAQNSSMDGAGSVVSEQHAPRYQQQYQGQGRDVYYQQGHSHHQQQYHNAPQQGHYNNQEQTSFPPPPQQQQQATQRTMVLSMAFTDPLTGQRGTYTGQVNSINHKPDGKGTVYYANGSIAEGSWMNGMLVNSQGDDANGSGGGGGYEEPHRGNYGGGGGNYHHDNSPPEPNRSRASNQAPHRDPPPSSNPRPSRSQSRSRRHKSSGSGGGAPFTGNLDRLDKLGGRSRVPRGASASVQSYNSRGSNYGPSGSASVQYDGGGISGSASVQDYRGGGGDGGGGGVYSDLRRDHRGRGGGGGQQRQSDPYGRSNQPPGYR